MVPGGGYVSQWRSSFPRALSCSLSLRDVDGAYVKDVGALRDKDIALLAGVTDLNITGRMTLTGECIRALGKLLTVLETTLCRRVTDKAFVGIPNLLSLTMQGNSQSAVTDNFTKGLPNLTFLDMSDCVQLTDVVFEPLRQLEHLTMCGCDSLTDHAFRHLPRLHTLTMTGCVRITDEAFGMLPRLRELNISGCLQHSLSDKMFRQLSGLEVLIMKGCCQTSFTDKMFRPLRGLLTLNMSSCTQRTITDEAFAPLQRLTTLTVSDCTQFSDRMFERLPASLSSLNISSCKQTTITDEGIRHLLSSASRRSLVSLNMAYCNQPTITDKAFDVGRELGPNLRELNISRCNQKEITTLTLERLSPAAASSASAKSSSGSSSNSNSSSNIKVLKTVGLEFLWQELEHIKRERGAQHLRDKIKALADKTDAPPRPSWASGEEAAAAAVAAATAAAAAAASASASSSSHDDCDPESQKKATVPLHVLTCVEVTRLISHIQGMDPVSRACLKDLDVTGHMLDACENLDEMKALGVTVIRAKLMMVRIKNWRKEGVMAELILPPGMTTTPPAPAPAPAIDADVQTKKLCRAVDPSSIE